MIELMVVVIIIGILASLALPHLAATKDKAYVAGLRSDVRNAQLAEEEYFSVVGTYGTVTDLQQTTSLKLTANDAMNITLTTNGYTISATNSAISTGPSTCEVSVGLPSDSAMVCP
jgi:general secretion pathway protein G